MAGFHPGHFQSPVASRQAVGAGFHPGPKQAITARTILRPPKANNYGWASPPVTQFPADLVPVHHRSRQARPGGYPLGAPAPSVRPRRLMRDPGGQKHNRLLIYSFRAGVEPGPYIVNCAFPHGEGGRIHVVFCHSEKPAFRNDFFIDRVSSIWYTCYRENL